MTAILTILAIMALVIICIGLGMFLVINYLCGDFWRDLTYVASKEGR